MNPLRPCRKENTAHRRARRGAITERARACYSRLRSYHVQKNDVSFVFFAFPVRKRGSVTVPLCRHSLSKMGQVYI